MNLPESIHSQVARLSENGNELADLEDYDASILCFEQALDLLPEPIEQWVAACWLFTAIGDAYFLAAKYDKALQPLLDATKCSGGIGNPFLHLRLGQTQLELGNTIVAADELTRAYMGAGKDIFEEEDPKFFALLKTVLKKPPTGW